MSLRDNQAVLIGQVLGEIIVRERAKREMNIEKFSKLLGVPRSSVYNIEAGRAPNIAHFDRMVDRLELSWVELGKEIETKRSKNVYRDGENNSTGNGTGGYSLCDPQYLPNVD